MRKIKLGCVCFCVVAVILHACGGSNRSIHRRQHEEKVASVGNGDRVALVVGNADYDNFTYLRNPVRDARAMEETLQEADFDVILATDQDEDGFYEALRTFEEKIRRSEVALFFFSGHGVQVDGSNYLIPIGADIKASNEVAYKTISANQVLRKMKDAGCEVNIVILDACRDNPFEEIWHKGAAKRGLARMPAPEGTRLIYSAMPGEVALDGDGRLSPFTRNLTEQIRVPGQELERLIKKVALRVRRDTKGKQQIWSEGLIYGDFYFIPVPDPTPEPPPEPPIDEGQLTVKTSPENAVVQFQNSVYGYSPAVSLPAGGYQIVVSAPGCKPQQKYVQIRAGEDERIEVRLECGYEAPGPNQWMEPTTGMAFVWIPEDCFMMGSPRDEIGHGGDEEPVHEVCVDGFWMGKHEVTNAQFRLFRPRHDSGSEGKYDLDEERQPVVDVTHSDAVQFAEWLSRRNGGRYRFRLPSEAEWEYACRGGTRTARFWGDDPAGACEYANVHDQSAQDGPLYKVRENAHGCDDGFVATAPAGSFKPNPFGLHDMLGNVYEWCGEFYAIDAYRHHKRHNPRFDRGVSNCWAFRGGSWRLGSEFVRCAERDRGKSNDLNEKYNYLGFRLVREP